MYLSREAMAKRIVDYVRIRRMEKKDPEKIRSGLQKGLGIEHPERVHGYAGFFWNTGNVYASGYIAKQMDGERFRRFVWESLERYDQGDFGDISRSDREENIENRYLFGNAITFGRYGYDLTDRKKEASEAYYEVICIRTLGENTWVTVDSEEDWFLFLRDGDIEKLKDRSWPAVSEPKAVLRDEEEEKKLWDMTFSEKPCFPVHYRRGMPSTESALRLGIITEADVED